MCEYLSFCGDLDGDKFWFEPMLSSHSTTAKLHKLKPDTYREFEWIGAEQDSLTVRVHPDDKRDAAYLRTCVLAKWPDRKSLEDWLIANVDGARIQNRFAKGGDRSTLTGGDECLMSFLSYDGNKYIRVFGVVGQNGLKRGVAYIVVDRREETGVTNGR